MVSLNPFRWFKNETKASAVGPLVSAWSVGQPQWTPRNYEELAKESYVENAIAFRCVAMIAQSGAAIPLLLHDAKNKELEKHPAIDLLAKPAPGYTQTWLFESLLTYLQLAGNSYVEAVGPLSPNKPPKELWSQRPDRMRVIPGPNGLPQGYEYSVNGKTKRWEVDPITGASDILHIKRFHPLDDWYGLSSTEPAAYAIDRHNEAGAHNMAVLQNGATPSGALVFKPVRIGDEDVTAPQSLIDAAEKRLTERYAGARNAGKPMVLGGNVGWEQFGFSMEELQLVESKLDAARDICIAYGVPIELLLPGQSTFNNKREAKLAFYEETVLPTHQIVLDHLNNWLLPRFGEGLTFVPNLDEIEALALRREMRQEQTTKLWEAGLILRDEAREAMQFEPRPDLPQRKVDAAVLTALVNATTKESAMYEPLYNYLVGVGLIGKGADGNVISFEDWLLTADSLQPPPDPQVQIDALPPQTQGQNP
jgi:HK97 family phage portal protein